jgi:predicted ATPase/class 3 adenylate cyclase
MVDLPAGTVTFLFTDLEGSTRLWDEYPDAMPAALARHDEILRSAVEKYHGHVVKTTGDGLHAVFATAHDAVDAAGDAQRALVAEAWGSTGPLKVRMGVHTSEAELRDGDYYGGSVNRAARLMSAAHGGQVIVSRATTELSRDREWEFIDLGEHRLQDLARSEQVFQLSVPDTPHEFPPLRSVDALPGNLPRQLTSFVGRDDEVQMVSALVDERQVVTLTGVGGMGKTRLALEVAAAALPRFRHGAWVIELAPVREPAAVAEAAAAVFGLKAADGEDAGRVLVEALRLKELLLIVDNCEHVLGPATALIRDLVQHCADVTVLATSREGLGLPGEHVVGVASLTLPGSMEPVAVAESEAGRLFVERASLVAGSFAVHDGNAAAIAEVVERLDGIPLAIELAAARVGVLSPSQIAQRLDQRFRLLAGGTRGGIERHATLRAAVDWSYELLDEPAQLLLARLSVFAGGCTLDAAEAVCADDLIQDYEVLDLLAQLVARSLVVTDTSDPGEHRYRLLETIRQYAEERLEPAEHEATSRRHAYRYAEFAESALVGVRGADPRVWLSRIELETENIRAAISWAVEHDDGALVVRLIEGLETPLFFFPISQVFDAFIDEFVDMARRSPHRYPLLLALAATVANVRGDIDAAVRYLDEMRADAAEFTPHLAVWDHMTRMNHALSRGDLAMAIEHTVAAVDCAATFNMYEQAWDLANLAAFRSMIGDLEGTAAAAEHAMALSREIGNPLLAALALGQLAFVSATTDPAQARAFLIECAEQQRALGDRYVDDTNFVVAAAAGALVREVDVTLHSAAAVLDRGATANLLVVMPLLETVASVVASAAPEDAAVVHGAVDALVPGLRDWGTWSEMRRVAQDEIAAQLSADEIEQAHARGAAMTLDPARAFVAALIERQRHARS